jgi:hypothetical protein
VGVVTYESGSLQHGKMLRDGRAGNRCSASELADGTRARSEVLE